MFLRQCVLSHVVVKLLKSADQLSRLNVSNRPKSYRGRFPSKRGVPFGSKTMRLLSNWNIIGYDVFMAVAYVSASAFFPK